MTDMNKYFTQLLAENRCTCFVTNLPMSINRFFSPTKPNLLTGKFFIQNREKGTIIRQLKREKIPNIFFISCKLKRSPTQEAVWTKLCFGMIEWMTFLNENKKKNSRPARAVGCFSHHEDANLLTRSWRISSSPMGFADFFSYFIFFFYRFLLAGD